MINGRVWLAICETFKHTIIFAILVGIASVMIELGQHKLSGFLYGALPLGFLYMLYVSENNRTKRLELSYQTWIGGIFFFIYIFIVWWLLKVTKLELLPILAITSVLFVGCVYLYNMLTGHLDPADVKDIIYAD